MLGFAGCPLTPKRVELVAVPGDQAAFALIDVCERPGPVPLDFKKPFWMTKRVTGTTERHGLE
jgi:hypothetical protein